ncbi:MAG: agmatinase family protein [Flavobacteriaceae bacterium]
MQKIVLQGISYDDKSSFLKGTAAAPPAIRECYHSPSANYYAENGLEISAEIFQDNGDLSPNHYFDIEEFTKSNLNDKFSIITLGGDHSITYPVLRAFREQKGPVDILHIDAHADLYEEFEGDRYSHACPFARIMEEGLTDRLVQVGIRTLTQHQQEQAKKYDVEIIPAARFSSENLPEFKNPVYLSLDIDALDPAFAPGISHYEPGGLTSRQVLDIIQHINMPLLGADIVEYNPSRDFNQMTGMLCAKFLKEISAKMLEFS